jgi:hypothetical protein
LRRVLHSNLQKEMAGDATTRELRTIRELLEATMLL